MSITKRDREGGALREDLEERVAEIRHRLLVETACGGSGCVPEFLEREEELLDELRELERTLDAGEPGQRSLRRELTDQPGGKQR